MSTFIRASLLAMAESEILGFVAPRILQDIKREDPHPLLKAFVISQEGPSSPTLVGFGQVVQRWFRSAVQAIVTKLKLGTKVFHLHETDTNDHMGRKAIGEVIGKGEREIEGALAAIAITYIYPAFKKLPLDIASIEADLLVPHDRREFDVSDVQILGITGIALGNSAISKPAFPGATLQAQLQAFAENDPNIGGSKKMTPAEIKKAIREAGLHPSDVFTLRELTADPAIEEELAAKSPANAEFARMRRELTDAEKKAQAAEVRADKAEKDLKDAQTKLTDKDGRLTKIGAREVLAAAIKERKLVDEAGKPKNEKLIKFINKSFEKSFVPTDENSVKKELDKFLDAQVDEFKELFGDPGKTDIKGGPVDKDGPGTDDAGGGPAEDEYTDPEKNPLIPR